MKAGIGRMIMMAMAGMMVFSLGCKGSAIGLSGKALRPCPKSPNCVSSMAEDEKHHIAPLTYEGSAAEARARLIAILESAKRVEIISSTENYIHAEFTSLIFRFVDDVEFYFGDGQPIIHLRSASRVGYSDLGANRKRIEAIRGQFEK